MSAGVLLLGAAVSFAQEIEPPPAEAPPGLRIEFLPPPLDGTLSLGIFDPGGTLVRTVKSESTEKDYVVGLNGFITSWDGRTDSGAVAASGNYEARGFAVGDIECDGIIFCGNDWIEDADTPRFRRIKSVVFSAASGEDAPWLIMEVENPDGRKSKVAIDREGKATRSDHDAFPPRSCASKERKSSSERKTPLAHSNFKISSARKQFASAAARRCGSSIRRRKAV